MCETKSLTLWLFQIIGLIGLLALCIWLALCPRSPSYMIVNFPVPSVNDSNASDHGIIQYESYALYEGAYVLCFSTKLTYSTSTTSGSRRNTIMVTTRTQISRISN
ncbi:hypothetical protein V6N13_078293 [Hibiscus sabdariffa]|uniref:Uncharacterized protein n=1 Tax=Hibiscus sabdariffa TaxID=183260 RepID=A0ABR2RN42_9ROSI